MMSDMPPSYEIATGNVTASCPRLLTPLNPTRTEYLDSKDYEISRLKKEIQGLRKLISKKDKSLRSNSNKIQNYKLFICVLIMLISIVIAAIVVYYLSV